MYQRLNCSLVKSTKVGIVGAMKLRVVSLFKMAHNVSGIAEGGDYLHNSPLEAQKFNVVQLLISGTSAPTFGNTLLAAGVFKLT